jgi:hypothetical protein
MKKVITFVLAIIMCIGVTACGKQPTEPQNATESDTEPQGNYYMLNGKSIVVADYYGIEDTFVMDMIDNGYQNISIYNPDELTNDILTHRTESDNVIIERCIGVVTNKENPGDGMVLNTEDTEYNYISYRGVDFNTCDGTIILTYLLYNPGTDYEDDIMERYDFVLDRNYED